MNHGEYKLAYSNLGRKTAFSILAPFSIELMNDWGKQLDELAASNYNAEGKACQATHGMETGRPEREITWKIGSLQ